MSALTPGFDHAVRYTKASKGSVHAYWIHAIPPNSQYVYLVVDGNPLAYSFSGEISPALYEAILSNLKVSPAPEGGLAARSARP